MYIVLKNIPDTFSLKHTLLKRLVFPHNCVPNFILPYMQFLLLKFILRIILLIVFVCGRNFSKIDMFVKRFNLRESLFN